MLEKIKKIDTTSTISDAEFIENKKKTNEDNLQAKVTKTVKLRSEDSYQEITFDEKNEKTDESIEIEIITDENNETITEETDKTKETEIAEENEENEENEDDGIDMASFKNMFRENDELDELISDIGYQNLFDAIDENNDGKIIQDEIEALGLDIEKLEDLTAEDIEKIANKIKEKEEDDEIDPEKLQKLKEALGINNDEKETNQAINPSNGGNSVGSYGGGSYGGSGNGNSVGSYNGSSSTNKSAAPQGKTIEDLEKEKVEKQTTLDKANDELQKVASGENEKVKAAKDDADIKKENYEKLLKEDEKVSEELKEKQKENADKITESEAKIEENEAKILEDDEKITSLTGEITSLNASLTQYQASLAALPSYKTEDNEKNWANIEAMRSELNSQISETKSQIEAKEKEKKETEETKKKDEETLKTEKDTLEELQKEREEIEKEIEKTCSEETKNALEEYKAARENIETVRETETKIAKEAVDKAQKEIDNINKEIDELKQKEIEKKYSQTAGGEAVAEFIMDIVTDSNGNMTSIDAGTMYNKMTAAGCRFDDGAWCGDFVAYALKETYGEDNVPGDYLNTCSNTAYVPTIRSWGEERGVLTDDTSRVRPGDIIVYGEQHVGVVESVNNDGTVNTVEGNTSNGQTGAYGSPTGDGWCSYHQGKTGSYICLSELK